LFVRDGLESARVVIVILKDLLLNDLTPDLQRRQRIKTDPSLAFRMTPVLEANKSESRRNFKAQ